MTSPAYKPQWCDTGVLAYVAQIGIGDLISALAHVAFVFADQSSVQCHLSSGKILPAESSVLAYQSSDWCWVRWR